MSLKIRHFGAIRGVDGSLHELTWSDTQMVGLGRSGRCWIDCGGWISKKNPQNSKLPDLLPEFICVTHAHYDHIGRIPDALVAGFKGPIYATPATVQLLPALLEESLKLQWTRNARLIQRVLKLLNSMLVPVKTGSWFVPQSDCKKLKLKFHPAGHILGSCWVEAQVDSESTIVFSGDLGRSGSALLPGPSCPTKADVLVLESTYGGRFHPDPANRKRSLHTAILHALDNDGSILVPAFSLGRVQELLVELDFLKQKEPRIADLEIILDSPIALKLTEIHRSLQSEWSQQAKRNWQAGRRPLSPESFTPIESHSDHLRTVKYLKKTGRPALVLASSGMCEGGRIVNYLKHLLPDPRHDVLFLGYQARGTLGESIQRAGRLKSPSKRVVNIQGQQTPIRAAIRTLSGYSAHADHAGLLNFAKKLKSAPKCIRLVHGDRGAKVKLKKAFQEFWGSTRIVIP